MRMHGALKMSLFNIVHSALSHPRAYLWLQRALGADRLRRLCLDRFAKLKPGERILDLGCGPGYIRDFMPPVDYVGFDTEQRYIDYARQRYAGLGEFHCEVFTQQHVDTLAPFDAILLLGVLHHLDDSTASDLMRLLSSCLKPGGRIVTVDPCFTSDQSTISRYVAESDRGRYVRTAEGYDALARSLFFETTAEIFHNVCRIPSTERIMRLSKPRAASSKPSLSAASPAAAAIGS
jgi:SAM-dependent methyltransferase